MAAECPAVLGTRWRRLPAVASGNYYYNHYDEVLNGAGSTLTVPRFGLKNGVHPTRRLRSRMRQSRKDLWEPRVGNCPGPPGISSACSCWESDC